MTSRRTKHAAWWGIIDKIAASLRPATAALALTVVLSPAILASQTAPAYREHVLHSFTGTDGANPFASLVQDSAGNFYGAAFGGGALNNGVVFKLGLKGKLTVLHNFAGTPNDGSGPVAGLVRDSAGNLYGTTVAGGASDYGTVFMLGPTGKETVLHSFTRNPDGADPQAGLVRDSAGNLFGTTSFGGASDAGTVFKLSLHGKLTVLHSFAGNGTDGAAPYATLVRDSRGNLYGTTISGGTSGGGVVFKVTRTGTETVLYSFMGSTDGSLPQAGLVRDSAGNLYGTTAYGGASGNGTVFKLDTAGTETLLHSFAGGADGAQPRTRLLRDNAGNLYGTTEAGGSSGCGCGLVFRLAKTGKQTVLHAFSGRDGQQPDAGLISDTKGNLYSTTAGGGASGNGVVFNLMP